LFAAPSKKKRYFRIPNVISYSKEITQYLDLTGEKDLGSYETGDMSTEKILESIQSNAVYGFGGAAYSTHQKIEAVMNAKVSEKHLIINGVECDPALIHDQWLLRQHPDPIVKGIELISECVPFSSITLAVKEVEGLNYPVSLKVQKVPDYYPLGAERLLINEVLDKHLSTIEYPAQHGILVLNVQTVYSIYRAVYCKEKADTKFLTVANIKGKTGSVVKLRLGMKVGDVMDAVYPNTTYIFAGGGSMQSHISKHDDIVDKTVNFIATAQFPKFKESPLCSKCGFCRVNCPVGLQVDRIVSLVDKGDVEKTSKYFPQHCISCGSCSYSCLAGKNLAARMKIAKDM